MTTSRMHRRPFEGRHLVLVIVENKQKGLETFFYGHLFHLNRNLNKLKIKYQPCPKTMKADALKKKIYIYILMLPPGNHRNDGFINSSHTTEDNNKFFSYS